MSKALQRKYYARKIEGLRSSNPRLWWRSVKLIMGLKSNTTRPMTGLASQLHDGDMQALVDSVNRLFFHAVAADLSPLEDRITPPSPEVVPYELTISQRTLSANGVI